MKNYEFRIWLLIIVAIFLLALLYSCGTRQKNARNELEIITNAGTVKTVNNSLESKSTQNNKSSESDNTEEVKKDLVDSTTTTTTTTYYGSDGKPTKKKEVKKTSKKTDKSNSKKQESKKDVDTTKVDESLKDHSEIEAKVFTEEKRQIESISVNRSNTLYQNIGGWKTIIIVCVIGLIGFFIWRKFK